MNKRILEVQKQVWESGGNELGLPRRDNEDLLVRPDAYDSYTDAEKKKWRAAASAIFRRNVQHKANRKHYLSTLAIAELSLVRSPRRTSEAAVWAIGGKRTSSSTVRLFRPIPWALWIVGGFSNLPLASMAKEKVHWVLLAPDDSESHATDDLDRSASAARSASA